MNTSATEPENYTRNVFGEQAPEWSYFICYQVLGFPISFFGVLGNIMSIHIWTQKEMQWGSSSTSWYLVALSCSDVLYLLTLNFAVLLPGWKKLENGELHHMFEDNDTLERLNSIAKPLSDTLVNISIYLVVAFTFERFIAVTYPMKGRLWCTPQRARYVILVLIAAVVVLQIPGFLEHDPTMIKRGYPEHKLFRIGYNWGVMVLFFAVLPIILLSCFNSILIRQVFVSRKQRKTLMLQQRRNTVKEKKSENFIVVTMTVILVVIIFFICHTPAAVMLCIYNYKEQFGQFNSNAHSTWQIAFSAANLLSLINSSVNFLLYSIFSAKFRKMCAKKYCRWCVTTPTRLNSGLTEQTYLQSTTKQRNEDTENGTALPLLDNQNELRL